MKKIISEVKESYRLCVKTHGKWKARWLLASAPFRLVIFLVGLILHQIGAFLMGDFHD